MAKCEMQAGVSCTTVYELVLTPSSALLCFMYCLTTQELAQSGVVDFSLQASHFSS